MGFVGLVVAVITNEELALSAKGACLDMVSVVLVVMPFTPSAFAIWNAYSISVVGIAVAHVEREGARSTPASAHFLRTS
jgi:hypothetical protein